MKRIRLSLVFTGLVLAIACSCSAAYSAGKCSPKTYREARSAMSSRLLAAGYTKMQVNFLMRNADRMTSALPATALNESGQACGIDSARAHVLGCLDRQLFPLGAAQALRLIKRSRPRDFGAGSV